MTQVCQVMGPSRAGSIDNPRFSTVLQTYMIDPWFFAAFCLGLLAACALIRVVRIPVLFDRIVAAAVTLTVAATAGIVLSIALGTVLILDLTIVIVVLGYAAIIASGTFAPEAAA